MHDIECNTDGRRTAHQRWQHTVLVMSIAGAALAATAASPALAQQAGNAKTLRYAIPAGPLDAALASFAKTSGVLLVYKSELVRGRASAGLKGEYDIQPGLQALLAGSGVEAVRDGDTWTLRAAPASVGAEQLLPAVQVTDGFERSFRAVSQESASKTGLAIREIPQSISVVTQEQIQTRQVRSVKEALETVAGVNQYSGTGPFAGISGFGFFATQIRGVDIDQRYDIREDGFISPPFYTRPDLAIYDRIEVVKGPSSVLNGRGSAGGFINQIRKKPKSSYESEFEASAGSWDSYRLDADITGPLTDSGNVRGRAVAAISDTGSFVDGVEGERRLLAPSVEADITDRTRVLVQAVYQKDRFVGNPGVPLVKSGDDKYEAPAIPRSRFIGLPNHEKNNWEIFGATAQVDHQINDDWLATLRLNRVKTRTPIDMDSYAYSYGGVAPDGTVMLISSAFDPNDTDVWSTELRVQGNLQLFGRDASLAFGADRAKVETHRVDAQYQVLGIVDIHATNFEDYPTIDPEGVIGDATQKQKASGVFAEMQVRPLDRLSVLGGLRYDKADTSNLYNGSYTDSEDDAVTGRLGVVYDVQPDISVYGLYAQSFKPVSSRSESGGVLDPEMGEIYEAGVKTSWFDGRVSANAAVFRIDRDDVPIAVNGLGPSYSVSAGLQRTDGVEFEVNGNPLPGWELSLGTAVVNSDFVRRDDPNYGNQPEGTGNWQAGAYTGYELQSGPLRGFGLGIGAFAIGDRGLDDRVIDGYERFDAYAFYNGFKRVKLSLQVRNVTNETYIEGFDRSGAYAQFGAPTSLMLSVRFLDGGNVK
jgi:TonB-dependent siderophore receptor